MALNSKLNFIKSKLKGAIKDAGLVDRLAGAGLSDTEVNGVLRKINTSWVESKGSAESYIKEIGSLLDGNAKYRDSHGHLFSNTSLAEHISSLKPSTTQKVIGAVKNGVEKIKNAVTKGSQEVKEGIKTTTADDAGLNDFQKQTHAFFSKKSGGKFNADAAGITEDDHWFTKNAKKYHVNRLNNERENLYAQLQGAKSAEELDSVMKDHGIKYSKGAGYDKMNEAINAHYQNKLKQGASYGDYFMGNHGPGVVALGATGAFALHLANSRGQKSNSDLYSNPF